MKDTREDWAYSIRVVCSWEVNAAIQRNRDRTELWGTRSLLAQPVAQLQPHDALKTVMRKLRGDEV